MGSHEGAPGTLGSKRNSQTSQGLMQVSKDVVGLTLDILGPPGLALILVINPNQD